MGAGGRLLCYKGGIRWVVVLLVLRGGVLV